MQKYYQAYEERYRAIHDNDLLWFIDEPSEELIEWLQDNKIDIGEEICEIGCGEGRDSLYLAELGYNITAFDISESAIKLCKKRAEERKLDATFNIENLVTPYQKLEYSFRWIFSVSTLHMLIEDNDRISFLKNIHSMLENNGKFLLVNMGNGTDQKRTNTEDAFKKVERIHMATGTTYELVSTSFRQDSWEELIKTVEYCGFNIIKKMLTTNQNYNECMTLYLEKKI